MITILRKIFDETIVDLQNKLIKEKTIFRTLAIEETNPLELITFMMKNNVPGDVFFSIEESGSDWDSTTTACLAWKIKVPKTNKELEGELRKRFHTYSFRHLLKEMEKNNYKRRGFSSSAYRDIKSLNPYDLYRSKNFKELETYYSFYFEKIIND